MKYKFRAWLKDENKMVKVSELRNIDTDIKSDENIIYFDFEKQEYCCKGFDEIELMQYTGLKDQNGVEIYEGDIVKDERERIFVIEYKFGGFNIVPLMGLNDEFSWNPLGDMQTAGWLNESAKIIGNIFKNKELLKNE